MAAFSSLFSIQSFLFILLSSVNLSIQFHLSTFPTMPSRYPSCGVTGAVKAAYVFCLLPFLTEAHIQLSQPFPIRSPLDPANSWQYKDYDYLSPLEKSGRNFPCKGWHTDRPIRTTAKYIAGENYTVKFDGSASHSGGSCQLSLSFDEGTSFKVIKSMVGGCPVTKVYDFHIPTDTPSGTALFAWTWLNHEGNREYVDFWL